MSSQIICKQLIKLRRPSFTAYSGLLTSREDTLDRSHNLTNSNINIILINQKRNLSLEPIIKWQQETYISISNSSLVSFMQDGLHYIHEASGLTWWSTIVTSTIVIRAFMTLPLSIYQNYILAKVENIGLELQDLVNELKKETAIARKVYSLSDRKTIILYKRSLKKQWRKLIERDNCHPLKATIVIWFQIPLWTPIIASIYTSGRNEQYFSKPEEFLPYRWDRTDERKGTLKNHIPFASLPFALGARSCVGRKIAMTQLTELVWQVVNNFDFKCINGPSIKPITSQALIPNKNIVLSLKVRNQQDK